MLIISMEDTERPLIHPVQFESTMTGAYDEEGQLIVIPRVVLLEYE